MPVPPARYGERPAQLPALPKQKDGRRFSSMALVAGYPLGAGRLSGGSHAPVGVVGARRPRIAPRVTLARPSLLIANHLTAFDVPVILYALNSNDRDHVAVAMSGQLLTGWRRGKAERHRLASVFTPLAYWLVSALFNVFPLPRGAGLRQSFAHAGEAMDRGYHVLVFPGGPPFRGMDGCSRLSRGLACWHRSRKCRCSRFWWRV